MIEGKLEKKARSWMPKRELKCNQQKKYGLITESPEGSSASAPHRHAEGIGTRRRTIPRC
jgi:hypothetical protein